MKFGNATFWMVIVTTAMYVWIYAPAAIKNRQDAIGMTVLATILFLAPYLIELLMMLKVLPKLNLDERVGPLKAASLRLIGWAAFAAILWTALPFILTNDMNVLRWLPTATYVPGVILMWVTTTSPLRRAQSD